MGSRSAPVAWRVAGWVAWLALLAVTEHSLGVSPAGAEAAKRVEVQITSDKTAYPPGDPITLTLRAVNGTDRPVIFTFRNAQRFDFILRDPEGKEVWRWGARRMFAQVIGKETIPPSGALAYSATIQERLPPGVYTVTGLLTPEEGTLTATLTLRVEAR